MQFRIIGEIREVETIAVGRGVRRRGELNRDFGRGRWRKLKGVATVELRGEIFLAEIHWYEAHGIGRRGMKIKVKLE